MEKTREKEMVPDTCDGIKDRERFPATRRRDEKIDWRERERRRNGDRCANGSSTMSEQAEYGDRNNERRKGDTFPRMTKPNRLRDRNIPLTDYERERQMGRPKDILYENEREKERRRYRDMDMQCEREIARYREELRRIEMRKPVMVEPDRQRERDREFDPRMRDRRRESYPGVSDLSGMRDKETDRETHRQRDREDRYYPRLMEGQTESFSDRERRTDRQREGERSRKRDIKIEGESERVRGKERKREEDSTQRQKLYKSEGANDAERRADRVRERDRRREREAERWRDKAVKGSDYKETGYHGPKGENSERLKETDKPRDRTRDSRDANLYTAERGRYRDGERTRDGDRYSEREIEERERRRKEYKEKGRRKMEIIGELISESDFENEKNRMMRENLEDRDRENTSETDKERLKERTEEVQEDRSTQRNEEKSESFASEEAVTKKPKNKIRKMWLEPRSERKEPCLKEYTEREKAKERYIQRYKEIMTTGNEEEPERRKPTKKKCLEDKYRELEMAGEFMRDVDAESEEKRMEGDMAYDKEAMESEWQMEREKVADNLEEKERDEQRSNNRHDYLENEEGSEVESQAEKNRVLSADDGFVTVSSGGDDAEEEDFEDCKEFWEGGVPKAVSEQSGTTEDTENGANEAPKGPLSVFCVIDQTHPTSQTNENSYVHPTVEEAANQHSFHNMGTQGEMSINETFEKVEHCEQDIERAMDNLSLCPNEDKGEGARSTDQTTKSVTSLKVQIIPPSEQSEQDTQLFLQDPSETSGPSKNNGHGGTETHIEDKIQRGAKETTGDSMEHSGSDDTWSTHFRWAKNTMKEILGLKSVDTENARDDEEDELSLTWGEMDLRKLRRTRKRNSKFFNSQLYQEYSEVMQNREIQLSHSDSLSISTSSSPNHSPKLSHRTLPSIPQIILPQNLSQTSQSLNVPQQSINRPPSPRLSISAFSPTLWQDLPGVRTSPELEELTSDERRLQEVRFEVVTSEASYRHSLDIIVENFVMSKQLKGILSSQDKNWLFSRLNDVRDISHSFLSQLEEAVEKDFMRFTVCDIIIQHCPEFRNVYVPYLTNQSYQDKTYQRLMDESHEFRRVVEKLERNPVCQRLPLRSFLILPFQRITRLKLLVQNIVKRTASKTKDEAQAIKAMKLLEKMIQESNESISQMKNIESLVTLNAKVDFECKTLPLISQSRRLVREGPVTELIDFSLKDREEERNAYMHLFNDYLLVSLRKEGGRFTVIDHAPVSELRVENCRFKLHSLQKNLFRLHMPQKALLLRTDTQANKLRWISALSRPYPEIDFSAVQDIPQMQCIKAFVAQQPDELSLEKAEVLLVHQQSSDGWVEGTRLSDRQRGWAPESHLETIVSDKARKRNLLDTVKIATAAM
ncbi:zinc finger CCCH domain-containing protein 13-like isoform X2 [Carassius auratus]|uniref:Zinc finger CCCH domain-containing protein 13-like isoform X2 n=1 Tax=Carassius auratus TaxID=7957 RepID=A0A6P6R2W0_CARAU|nr:zinc finger CCCH domain-containing protein 13-like isoform X2 [Carassius auratus]